MQSVIALLYPRQDQEIGSLGLTQLSLAPGDSTLLTGVNITVSKKLATFYINLSNFSYNIKNDRVNCR